jgi:potassium efflux system protein
MAVGLPIVFVVATIQWQSNNARQESLGRLAFIVGMVVLAIFSRQMLRPGTGALSGLLVAKQTGGWTDRLSFLWYPLAAGIPLFLAVIAILVVAISRPGAARTP